VATYTTEEELRAYVADNDEVTLPSDAEPVLQRAERDVDRALGPYAVDPDTGLKLEPSTLTDAQQAALSRATCAAAEWRLQLGEATLTGDDDDFLPPGFTQVRTAGRQAPKLLEELAGSGLITWSGTVESDGTTAAA
jgi:hypothetical protein